MDRRKCRSAVLGSAAALGKFALEAVQLSFMATIHDFSPATESALFNASPASASRSRADQDTAEQPKIVRQRECRAGGTIGVETPYQPGSACFGLSRSSKPPAS